jgi:secondary thiamine-phosphate synthase enzyme
MPETINIKTKDQVEFIDITKNVQNAVNKSNLKDGFVNIYVPHTTAGITINENADPSVRSDIINKLNKLIPFSDNYAHSEGNSAAHIKSTLVGVSQMVPVENGRMLLGTWQGIFFCEFDGPRNRNVYIKLLEHESH